MQHERVDAPHFHEGGDTSTTCLKLASVERHFATN
jgi:hypothetical protein